MKFYLLYSTSDQLQQHFGFVVLFQFFFFSLRIMIVDQMVNGSSNRYFTFFNLPLFDDILFQTVYFCLGHSV